MSSLTLKDVPAELLDGLRRRAAAERRSLSQQALVLIARSLGEPSLEDADRSVAQVSAWRELCGEWRSDESLRKETARLLGRRTRGRRVDL
jgi:hypothetical protein